MTKATFKGQKATINPPPANTKDNINTTNTNEVKQLVEETENIKDPSPLLTGHKKTWRAYMIEFIMLFLAVYLGFVAENIRERLSEHNRAKEYAKSFLIDLKNDTTELNTSMYSDISTKLMTDSFVQFISKEDVRLKGGELYYLSRMANGVYITDWNKATLNQLLSSGNLRYFTNSQLLDKINVYNTTSANLSSLQQRISDATQQCSIYRNQIFKASSLIMVQSIPNNITHNRMVTIIDSFRRVNMPLQSYDAGLLNSYANALLATGGNRNYLLNWLYPEAKKQAIEIMELIKKEYQLENN